MRREDFISQIEQRYGYLIRVAENYLGANRADAGDVVNSAVLRALQTAEYETWNAFGAVVESVRRDAQDYRNVAARRHGLLMSEHPAVSFDPRMRATLRLDVQNAIGRLDAKAQHLVHRLFYQDATLREIAKEAGVSVWTAHRWWAETRETLRSFLAPYAKVYRYGRPATLPAQRKGAASDPAYAR